MADATVFIKYSEKSVCYGQMAAVAGATLTITSAPTWTLYGPTGAVVNSLTGQAVTGYTTAPSVQVVQVWQDFNPSTYALPLGIYTLVFTMAVTGSDGIARVEEPSLWINVIADSSS